jgi:hypothetical protein
MYDFDFLINVLDRTEISADQYDDRLDCLTDYLSIDLDAVSTFTRDLLLQAIETYEWTYRSISYYENEDRYNTDYSYCDPECDLVYG